VRADWRRRKKPDICERCGANVYIGDWPTCHGNPEEHGPQRGGWQWGEGSAPGSKAPLVLGQDLGYDGKVKT
jgi:hypothetical protein